MPSSASTASTVAEVAAFLHPLPRSRVQLGHVGPPPGVQPRLLAGRHVGGPGIHSSLEGGVSFCDSVNPLALEVPVNGLPDPAGPQLGQHFSLSGVELAPVLAEGVHRVPVPGHRHQGAQAPKTDAGDRDIPIPAWLCDDLAAMLAERGDGQHKGVGRDDFLFVRPTGLPLNLDKFRQDVVRPALRAAGLSEALRTYDTATVMPAS